MAQISPNQARNMLRQACTRYVRHKEGQLNQLIGESLYEPEDVSFIEILGKDAPEPGFNDWVLCCYYYFLQNIFLMSSTPGYTTYLKGQLFIDTEAGKCQHLKPMKLYGPYEEPLNHHDPDLVLYNLGVLVELLHLFMSKNQRDCPHYGNWAEIKLNKQFQESDYTYSDDAPRSLKINQTLKHFRALFALIETLPHYQSNLYLYSIRKRLERYAPVFDSYLKKLVAQELNEILENPALGDNQALELVAVHLNHPTTSALLHKNNQSDSEQKLKLLSVISILIGVGLLTTLALVAKRLYDTGGSSINFFKPLSTNLCEDIEQITHKTQLAF